MFTVVSSCLCWFHHVYGGFIMCTVVSSCVRWFHHVYGGFIMWFHHVFVLHCIYGGLMFMVALPY